MRRWRPGHGHDRRAPELSPRSGVADVTGAELEDLLRAEARLVLVDFWTARCEPCRELRPQLEALAARQSDARIVAVDADREPNAVIRYEIRDFPTLVFFKRGRELYRLKGGALPASTLQLLRRPAPDPDQG